MAMNELKTNAANEDRMAKSLNETFMEKIAGDIPTLMTFHTRKSLYSAKKLSRE